MNPLYGHWYEFTDGSVGKCEYLCECPPDQIRRDLTIGPYNLITAEDVGRWASDKHGFAAGPLALNGSSTNPFRATYFVGSDGSEGGVKYLTRWLSRAECRERKLDAQHPTQRDEPARKAGVFKVGDRVRATEGGDEFVVSEVFATAKHTWLLDEDGNMGGVALDFELIEPAREGEGAASSTAALNRGSDPATLPPAPPASDYERLAEFFRDKRPQAVPFALGQRVEVVRAQGCACCNGSGWLALDAKCPECK